MRPMHYKTEQLVDSIVEHIKESKVLQVVTDYYGDTYVRTYPVHSITPYVQYALLERRIRKNGLAGATVYLQFYQLDRIDLPPIVLTSYTKK